MKSRFLLAGAAFALLAAPFAHSQLVAAADTSVASKATIGAWGIDLAGGDGSVKPGDDFYRFASGKWDDATEIPADRATVGSVNELRERSTVQVKDLIMAAPAGSKYGAMYASFMNEDQVEKIGLAPLMKDLAVVRAIRNKSQFARHMGGTDGVFGISLFGSFVAADTTDPTINALFLGQGGIGLPEREYYFADQFKSQREAYRAYMERTFKALGNPDPKAAADAVFNFESNLAYKSWKAADRRDVDKTNNPMSSAELAKYAPGVDWAALHAGWKIPMQKRIVVREKTAIKAHATLFAETPLETLKLWQLFHIADQAAPYLTKAMVDSRFEYAKNLSGVQTQRPRWKRGTDLVDGTLGELVGKDYVAKHFPESSKAKMEALVANLKVAMAGRIKGNAWMSPTTKTAALDKLERMEVMVGYPYKFRNYDALKVDPKDLYGNVVRAGRFNADYERSQLGKKVDRKLWGMNPQTVNAYNGFTENKIVFPAGILQAPYFDPNADDAVNYGAIGGVIGHEITHGFDDQGRKVDATGAVRDWWAPEDAKRFEEQAKIFGDQYAKYEVAPGAFINPKLSMGENIADLGGLSVAHEAYLNSLGGKAAPVIDGLTGDQRFFLAWAQVWRTKMREAALRSQVNTGPHSPGMYRAFAPLRNIDGWYQAFNVQPGQKLYIAPEARARIW